MTATARVGFPSTRWSIVLAARRHDASEPADAALAALCEAYWYPIYAFVRRRGHDPEDAQDITQGFLTRLLEKGFLPGARPERGRFRSYLLGALKHFLANERDRGRAGKRGGGRSVLRLDFEDGENRYRREPAGPETPETIFERRWALTLLDTVLGSLERECALAGKKGVFESLKPFLIGEVERGAPASVARELSMTEGALRVAIHRLRRRYRELLRAEIAQTVQRPVEVDSELRHLLAVIGG